MNKEIPEWFIDVIRSAHGFAVDQQDDGEDHAENFIEEMWRRMSKPENQAKLKETKALIEAVKLYLKQGTVPLGLDLETALKPFEGE